VTTIEPRAGDQPPRPKTDAILRGLGQILATVFFREIEVVGENRLPDSGPVIVVANHFNSLIDGVLVASYLPRFPRFLGASTIWDYKLLRPFLKAAGVIPVFRHRDAGKVFARNQSSLAGTWDLLRAGGVLALFPEGISHNNPYLLPIKSGAARIALGAEEKYGPLGVTILPVGLVFDSKNRFRSRALIQIGAPIRFDADCGPRGSDLRRNKTKGITHEIETGLSAITQNFDTRDSARVLGRAADIWGQSNPILPVKQSLAETFERRRDFGRGYNWMSVHHPKTTSAVMKTLTEYDEMLAATGLRDEQVGATYASSAIFGIAARSLFALIVRLPLSIVGTALNWIPFQIARVFARGKDQDKMATWSLFSSMIIFPGLWLVQAAVCSAIVTGWFGLLSGWLVFLTVLLAAPLTGRATLRFHDLLHRLYHEVRAWFILRSRKTLAGRLVAKRLEVLDQLAGFLAIYRREKGED